MPVVLRYHAAKHPDPDKYYDVDPAKFIFLQGSTAFMSERVSGQVVEIGYHHI